MTIHAPEASLTRREREVFAEVIQGWTNAEIGTRLFLTETTVKTHVSAILRKLALPNRVHAVVYAYENGIARPSLAPSEDTFMIV